LSLRTRTTTLSSSNSSHFGHDIAASLWIAKPSFSTNYLTDTDKAKDIYKQNDG